MNRWNYIDQGDPTGAGGWNMEQAGPVPRDETDTLKAGNQWRGLPYETYAALLPGVERWTSGNQKPLGGDTGLLEDALSWMPQGTMEKLGTLGAAGLIRMGGKTYPNALFHRAIGEPKEVGWWAELFQRGLSSEKPASVVTPNVLQTFRSQPYGLLFNAPEENKIRWITPFDAWSEPTTKTIGKSAKDQRQRHEQAMVTLLDDLDDRSWRMTRGGENPWGGLDVDTLNNDPYSWWKKLNEHKDTLPPNHYEALKRLFSRIEEGDFPEQIKVQRWEPTHNVAWGGAPTLDDVFDLQRIRVKGDIMHGKDKLVHTEASPAFDLSNLAGVRLPLKDPRKPKLSAFEELMGESELTSALDTEYMLGRALSDFAEQMNVPIYRWPAVETKTQQAKGLDSPFAGKWGRPPGKDYVTSSRLPQIFGITAGELP